ncbi:MAG: hypothetical protein E7253_07385 [Lachnospiraceae bacterium]|nr:hypothetical protein [Lachnospiraceae bacterium]
MTDWNKYRENNIRIEKTGITTMIIIIIVGIIADIAVANGIVWCVINDIGSFSLTLLQIQASVGTLTIALVALISGNITDSYMGVSVSDYYLNIRPSILKQKIIILSSMLLLVVGVIAYVFEAFNSVFGVFVVTVGLIIVSIYEIYSIFSGKRLLQKEIEAYISYIMRSDKEYQIKVNLCDNFVQDWKECIESQDTTVYDRYVEIFCDYILILLKTETDESVKDVEKLSSSLVETFLRSDKVNVKKRGVQLSERIYEKLWAFILDNTESVKKISTDYTLFGNLQFDFQEAIYDLSAESVERIISWNYMADSIQRVAFWIFDKEKQKNISELDGVNYISRFWGSYMRMQQQKGNIINKSYWGIPLEKIYLMSAYNIPEERSKEFLYHKVEMYFNYFYGLIKNGFGDIIKESLYLVGMGSLHSIDNRNEALFYLAIQCYLYYLAERENEECVMLEVKQDASSIIRDEQIARSNEYIIQLLTYNDEFLNFSLEEDMYKLLRPFELHSKYSNVKKLLMQDVVHEFFLFILLHIEDESYLPGLTENAIDIEKIQLYYLEFLGAKEEETKYKFCKLSKMYDARLSDEEAKKRADSLYRKLEVIIKRKYKEKSIASAEEHQKMYESNGEYAQIATEIKEKVKVHLQEKFAPIIADVNTKGGEFKLHLLSSNEFTKNIRSNKVDQYYWEMDGALVNGVTNILQKIGLLDIKNKLSDFTSDIEYIEYLKCNDIDVLLGSQYAIKNKEYKNTELFKEYSEECKCIYTGFIGYGLALNSGNVKICIHDVNVSIHSLTLGETKLNFDEKKQRYIYEISHGMPVEFTKEELKTFIYNERKILDISVKVSVISSKEKVGIVINSDR